MPAAATVAFDGEAIPRQLHLMAKPSLASFI
jgi:hypothetical protein